MQNSKAASLLAMAAALIGVSGPSTCSMSPMDSDWRIPKRTKGDGNTKTVTRTKERVRNKAAHKTRMAQKRRK